MATLAERVASLEALVSGLKKEVGSLRATGPSRSEERTDECRKGADPDDCPFASTYQYQHKCGGASCRRKNTEYYQGRKPAAVKVEPPKRRKMVKRAPSAEG